MLAAGTRPHGAAGSAARRMALDLETLLRAGVRRGQPAGPDLAYAPVRSEVDQAFDSPVSVDANTGETVAPDIDWRKIVRQIEEQSRETKDLWLAVYLCRAGALGWAICQRWRSARNSWPVSASATGTAFTPSSTSNTDSRAARGRASPLASVAEIPGIPLRGDEGFWSTRAWGLSPGETSSAIRDVGGAAEGYDRFRAVLNETPDEAIVAAADQLEAVGQAIRRVDAILMANAEGDTGANFKTTYEAIASLKRAVLSFSSAPPPEAESAAPGGRSDVRRVGAGGRRPTAVRRHRIS